MGQRLAPPEADRLFASALRGLRPDLELRAEQPSDRAFLREMFIACARLADILPATLIEQQAEVSLERSVKRSASMSHWMVVLKERTIGRMAIDWDHEGGCYGIDIALLPTEQNAGIGGALLSAWIETADKLGRAISFCVDHDNPAIALYQRLGFAFVSDPQQPSLLMLRPPRG